MNRRTYLKTAGVAASAGLLAGCNGSTGEETTPTYGTLATSVTDMPGDIGDFETCVVTMAGIWVTPADGTESEATESGTAADGRRYIEFDEPRTADLVQLQGSNTQSLGETEVETGAYQYLQLDVTGVTGTLDGGGEASVDTPGNAPLKFDAEFDVRAAERTRFVADFTPVRRGTGSYTIRPVADGTTVLYGDAEYTTEDASVEGNVSLEGEAGGDGNASVEGNASASAE